VWFERFAPDDVFLPALLYLQKTINDHLEAKASPRLLWDFTGIRLDLSVSSASLLSMLWLQLANDVSGKMIYRECLSCKRWMRVGADTVRRSKQYCSNACRTRGLRRRQEMARDMANSGKSVTVIAEELDTDVDTVTKWVSGDEKLAVSTAEEK